jgi:hypothetical protein
VYSIDYDLGKNRLYVTCGGKMGLAEIKECVAELMAKSKSLRPGFGCITDISTVVPVQENGRRLMLEAMTAVRALGMGNVVRIAPAAQAVSALQWQRTSLSAGYTAMQVNTKQAAEQALDEIEKGSKKE